MNDNYASIARRMNDIIHKLMWGMNQRVRDSANVVIRDFAQLTAEMNKSAGPRVKVESNYNGCDQGHFVLLVVAGYSLPVGGKFSTRRSADNYAARLSALLGLRETFCGIYDESIEPRDEPVALEPHGADNRAHRAMCSVMHNVFWICPKWAGCAECATDWDQPAVDWRARANDLAERLRFLIPAATSIHNGREKDAAAALRRYEDATKGTVRSEDPRISELTAEIDELRHRVESLEVPDEDA